ncbi:hypothetical protein EDD11_005569 [Mortierella claussenii]|nr:hypothetical protein EDD11_005569 [Mortierella claussenii]
MAMEEAKLMGLELLPDPERNANAPRDHTNGGRAKYLYDNNDPEDWGSTASESDVESESDRGRFEHPSAHEDSRHDDDVETGGLTDRELDRLDGKTSSRIGRAHKGSIGDSSGAGAGSAPTGANKYPERDSGANTGPKGVIADQKHHQKQQLQERMTSHQAYNARMLAKAPMTTTFRQDQERERQEKRVQGLLDDKDEDEDEKVLRELEDEESQRQNREERAILERIRGNRMQDMSWAAKSGKGTGGVGAGGAGRKKVFGSLMEMNAAQYVNAIDTEKKDVTVIIHIYSEYNPACKKLDGCLIQLAGRYATTKFIRIKAREVDFDEEVCPTVLVYRAGDLIANLVMITYELSEEYDDDELEDFFTKNKVLSPHDQHQRESSFFESALDTSALGMSSMSSQFGELNLMSLGLGVGDGAMMGSSAGIGAVSGSSRSVGGRRGILSGNVTEFRYQDYEDDEDEDEKEYDTKY